MSFGWRSQTATLLPMGPVCARFSCEEPGAASLQFDTAASRVYLVDLTDAISGLPVCAAHAKTRTAPVGWELVDQRTAASRSESEDAQQRESATAAAEVAARRGRRRSDGDPTGQGPVFTWDRKSREDGSHSLADDAPEGTLLARAFRAS